MDSYDLTEKQYAVLDLMPATREDIAEELDISIRSVRYRQNAIEKETGMDFERDSDGVWYVSNDSNEERDADDSEEKEIDSGPSEKDIDDTDPWRVNSYDKAQATKEINNELLEMEKEVKKALDNASRVWNYYDRTDGKSTLVIPHSDAHIGAIIDERYGVNYYSAEEAQEVVSEYIDKCVSAAKERGDVEDVVLLLNGDHLDGEGIYPGQRAEQEDDLQDQLRKATRTYMEQILKLSDEFEFVDIYCVPGNHGSIDKRSTTNADGMLYDNIETALSYSDMENVNVTKAGPGGFVNFEVRGWEYFSRHGQDYLEHVGTSSGIRRALDWYTQYDGFDVGIRSHYHSIKYEPIADEVPIIMTGSPAPPSTFAESKAADGGCCGVYWFATDDRAIDGFQPIRLDSAKEQYIPHE